MANPAKRLREIFKTEKRAMTLTQIKHIATDLKGHEISMALCYLYRQRYVTRQRVPNTVSGRKTVWLYQYHNTRLTKDNHDSIQQTFNYL